MQTINLDLSVKSIIPILYAKQADVGRKVKVILTDNGSPFMVPTGAAASVWFDGTSGEGNYTDIGAQSAIVVSGNEITVEMITQMLAKPGNGRLCLVINATDGTQIGTWNIPYFCEAVPGAESSSAENYYTAFSEAVKNLPYPDATLSIDGKAADAGATGRALANKAPAGYGLGNSAAGDWSNIDNITKNGWYTFATYASINGITFSAAHMRVDAWDVNNLRQTLYLIVPGNLVLIRQRYGTVWTEWECVNPPMVPGVEYRTTKRYNGQIIYTKLVNCGTVTNEATVSLVDANKYRLVSGRARMGSQPMSTWCSGTVPDEWDAYYTFTYTGIIFHCGSSAHLNGDVVVVIEYIDA